MSNHKPDLLAQSHAPTAGVPASGGVTTSRLTANLFSIPFGLAGLAMSWAAAHRLDVGPRWPADVLWLIAAIAWLSLTTGYVRAVTRRHGWRAELSDPVFAPFVSLMVIIPMPLGVALAPHEQAAGNVLFAASATATLLLGAWITASWLVLDRTLDAWHPGYFLPTVAGGLVAATGCAQLGAKELALVLYGLGVACWFFFGSIIWLRLLTGATMPAPLQPTFAILLAPPVVANNAWFAINGARADTISLALAGYSVLMVLTQLRLLGVYRRMRFSAGFWAFGFSYAAAVGSAVQWLAIVQAPIGDWATFVLLILLTSGFGLLIWRSLLEGARGTFLLRVDVGEPRRGPAVWRQAEPPVRP